MLDSLQEGLLLLFHAKPFLYMLLGVFIGFWVGILPGIGGSATLAIMLPFIYRMTPQGGIPFLLDMHSVVQTTGDITSVLFGIPGEPTTVVTIMDGYPMAKNGEAGRALGAALMSALVGAIIGAIVLVVAIPLVKPLILSFGSPEMLMVIIIGIFTIPEIVDLKVRGNSIAGNLPPGKLSGGVMEGVRDTFRHGWLVIRCSLIGRLDRLSSRPRRRGPKWIAYAHAVQSGKTKEERAGFGKGAVRGAGARGCEQFKRGRRFNPGDCLRHPGDRLHVHPAERPDHPCLAPRPDMLTKHLALSRQLYGFNWLFPAGGCHPFTAGRGRCPLAGAFRLAHAEGGTARQIKAPPF